MRGVRLLGCGLAVVGLILGACTSSTTPVPSSGPTRGGTLTIATWQEPKTLSPLRAATAAGIVIFSVAVEGLVRADNDGAYRPVLAARVPTLENGGVRIAADGRRMDVTWELQPGLKWSDGEPVTSADIKFTWEARLRERSTWAGPDWSEIASVDLSDERTAVLHYRSIFASYVTTFLASGPPFGVLLPKHLLDGQPDISTTAYERLPIGTGPFRFTDFRAGDSVTAERNPNYRKPGRPYLDRILFKFFRTSDAAIEALKAGSVQGVSPLQESEARDLSFHSSVRLVVTPSPNVEQIQFNLAENRDMTDPESVHPVLGDLAFRRALVLATPKQETVDKLLFGNGRVGTSGVPRGWAARTDLAQEGQDPQKARQLLDQAGWAPGPDGFRARGGVRASLMLLVPSGNPTRARAANLLGEAYRQIGVELKLKDDASVPVLFAAWADGGVVRRGGFDMVLVNTGVRVDPQGYFAAFLSRNIPSARNGGVGDNTFRFRSAEYDALIDEAGSTVDIATRKAAYSRALQLLNDAVVGIWLYERPSIDAHRAGVNGWAGQTWDYFTWNTEDWYLAPTPP